MDTSLASAAHSSGTGAQKRPASSLDDAAAAAALETPAKVRLGGGDVFNPVMMRYYYQHFFPFKQMFEWLSYGNDPNSKLPGIRPDFFLRREFCYTLENDVYVRYLCFRDAEEFARRTVEKVPERMEIGPVYTAPPDKNKTLSKEAFKPEQRELIFDIDLNDYDDIRTCCVGANICKRCGSFMNVAIRVLDGVLRDDFGFKHIMFVYSGRRGMHCHVADEEARMLTDEQRKAVVDYIDALNGEATGAAGAAAAAKEAAAAGGHGGGAGGAAAGHTNINKVLNSLTVPLHPALSRAFMELETIFANEVIVESGQGLLCRPEHWGKILDMIPDMPEDFKIDDKPFSLRGTVEAAWDRPDRLPRKRWNQLKNTVDQLIQRSDRSLLKKPEYISMPPGLRRTLQKLIPAIVFAYIYPRLDANVSKMRNHLLKAPFCIHPKTGRVCVPIPLSAIDSFDPAGVPTLAQLMNEGIAYTRSAAGVAAAAAKKEDAMAEEEAGAGAGASSSGAGAGGGRRGGGVDLDDRLWEQTAMKPYIEEFQVFIDGLADSTRKARREASERSAAATNDW